MKRFSLFALAALFLCACACGPRKPASGQVEPPPVLETSAAEPVEATRADYPPKDEIEQAFAGRAAAAWGEGLEGIVSILPGDEKIIALTFDACGWGKGSGYDEALVEFLIGEGIPATLFLSGKWIEDNPGRLEYLAGWDNFEIENHGYRHRPLSVDGREAYGIQGTASPGEVYDEIVENALRIRARTGRSPLFFRAGTAYYDDVAVEIAAQLGVHIAGYTIAGDAGAAFSQAQILRACADAPPGAILLFHMNRPDGETFEGVRALCAVLAEKGFRFVKLEEFV